MSYLGNIVEKKRKNSNFRTAIKRENITRPRFYGECDRNTFEYRRIEPDLTVTFFLFTISLQKKIFCMHSKGYLSPTKKNTTRGKNISPLPNIEKNVPATNQADRCLEDR